MISLLHYTTSYYSHSDGNIFRWNLFLSCYIMLHNHAVLKASSSNPKLQSTVFWEVMPYSLVVVHRRFGRTYSFHLQAALLACCLLDCAWTMKWKNTFLWNLGKLLPDYIVSYILYEYIYLFTHKCVSTCMCVCVCVCVYEHTFLPKNGGYKINLKCNLTFWCGI
jgi:hypothetical protein